MQLSEIAPHRPEVARKKRVDGNILWKRLAHHFLQLPHQRPEFEPLEFAAATPRKEQHLPHHIRAADRAGLIHRQHLPVIRVPALAPEQLRAKQHG